MSKEKRFVKLRHAPRYFPFRTTERSLRNYRSRGYYPQIFVKIGSSIYVDLEMVKDIFWGGQEINISEDPLVRIRDSIKYFPFHVTEKQLRGWRSRNPYLGLFKKFAGNLYVDKRQIPGIIKAT